MGRKAEEKKQAAPKKQVEEEEEVAGDMCDPFEMMGGMGGEEVYKVTLIDEAKVPSSDPLATAQEEVAKLRKELNEVKAGASPQGSQPPMAKIIAAQEETNKQRNRAEQAEGRIQTLMKDLEAITAREQKAKAEAQEAKDLLKGEQAKVAALTSELEQIHAAIQEAAALQAAEETEDEEEEEEREFVVAQPELTQEDLEALQMMQAEAPVAAPAAPAQADGKKAPNKRERKKTQKTAEPAAAPTPAAAPAPAKAAAKKAPVEEKAAPMVRTTADLASAQDRLAKRVAALEAQKAIERERAEERRRQEEEDRRDEEEAARMREQIEAEEAEREARKLQAKADAAAQAAAKLRKKEERRRAAEEKERQLAREEKVFSKEDFEALQLLREEAAEKQPDAEVSPDELDEDEILDLEMRRAQKEKQALQNKAPANFLEMMMKAEGLPMMNPEVVEQAKQAQKNKQRNELKQKLQAKREMDKILNSQGVPKARR